MKKFVGTLALLLCLLALPLPAWAAEVYYHGQLLCQTEQLYDSVDGACVPVRQLFEGLGYEVKWEAEYNAVRLHHPQRGSMRLVLGNRQALILSNFDYEMPVAPYFHGDVLYAPLNLLKNEYANYKLEWLPETRRWLITDVEQPSIKPFAYLTSEQLTGVILHFGKQNSAIPIYSAELTVEDTEKLLQMLKALAYREQPFTGEALEFSGGYGTVFDLRYADGQTLQLGFDGPFYEFAFDDEYVGYLPVDDSQHQELKQFYKQLKEKYLALQNN